MILTAEEKIIKSRIAMLRSYPFFGILALRLNIEEAESVDTIGVDGKKLYYNSEFVLSLDERELNWAMVHEIMHCALGHIWRRGDRIPLVWNYATDYAIHNFMVEYVNEENNHNFLKMPEYGLYDEKYKDMSADKIYSILIDDFKSSISMGNGSGGSGSGSGGSEGDSAGNGGLEGISGKPLDNHASWENASKGGDESDGGGGNDGGNDGSGDSGGSYGGEEEWQVAVISAANQSSGMLKGCLARAVNLITKAQKDWRELISESIMPRMSDYGFVPPDRRYTGGLIMPDFNIPEDNLKIIFWIDASGSMSDADLIACYSEVVGCVNQFSNVEGYIGCFDSIVTTLTPIEEVIDILEYADTSKKIVCGGGGTSFHAPLKYTVDNIDLNDIGTVVILTDGYAEFSGLPNLDAISLVWIMTTHVKPPVGRYARIEIKR